MINSINNNVYNNKKIIRQSCDTSNKDTVKDLSKEIKQWIVVDNSCLSEQIERVQRESQEDAQLLELYSNRFISRKTHRNLILEKMHVKKGVHREVFIEYENGDIYLGRTSKGKKFVYGKMQYKNGDLYEGDFKNDMRNGSGRYVYSNGDFYIGEFLNDKRHGKGRLKFFDGVVYDGYFKDDKMHGKGIIRHNDIFSYEGEFLNGYLHGNGKLVDSRGNLYEIEFRGDDIINKTPSDRKLY